MLRQRRPRNKKSAATRDWLDFIASLPCAVTGAEPAEVAHIRYADPRFDKRQTGLGEKPDDRWVIPLSPEMHRLGKEAQHAHSERAWWAARGLDPLAIATTLRSIWERASRDVREYEARSYLAMNRMWSKR